MCQAALAAQARGRWKQLIGRVVGPKPTITWISLQQDIDPPPHSMGGVRRWNRGSQVGL
jgi:hypothetical protein